MKESRFTAEEMAPTTFLFSDQMIYKEGWTLFRPRDQIFL